MTRSAQERLDDTRHRYIAANPVWEIDLNRQMATNLHESREKRLERLDCEVLYWAARAYPLAAIAAATGRTETEISHTVTALQDRGMVELAGQPDEIAAALRVFPNGETIPPPADQTLAVLGRKQFARLGESRFLVFDGTDTTVTFAQAWKLIGQVVAALRRDGVSKGDYICTQSGTGLEAGCLFWACALMGAIYVPINNSWGPETVAEILESCGARAIFADPELAPGIATAWPGQCLSFDGGAAEPAFSEWLAPADENPRFENMEPSDPVVVLFTSGTTGMPKGVVLSHGALYRSSRLIVNSFGLNGRDIMLSPGDFHAIAGLRNPLICTVMSGASCVIPTPAQRQVFLGIIDLCDRHNVTVLKTIPRLLRRMCQFSDRLEPGSLSSLRLIISGTAPLLQSTLDEVRALFDIPVYDYLGITEASGASIFCDLATGGSVAANGGLPMDLIAQVVNEQGELVGDGEVGEIRLYGDRLMTGYLGQPELTREVLRDNWFYTGDLAMWGEDGRLHIMGRRREMIKVMCGEVVYPWEIENVIAENAAVGEVAVCGFVDAVGEDRIAAFIIKSAATEESQDDISAAVKARVRGRLGDNKVPSHIQFVDDMPRGAHQKIKRPELVERYLNNV